MQCAEFSAYLQLERAVDGCINAKIRVFDVRKFPKNTFKCDGKPKIMNGCTLTQPKYDLSINMRVLVIKTSSLGDVFHCFPALTDAVKQLSNLEVDWVVEEGFADLVHWHPSVSQVFVVAVRRWRKSWWRLETRNNIRLFVSGFNQYQKGKQPYDVILDAQGLLKSALIGHLLKRNCLNSAIAINYPPLVGLDWASLREPLSSVFYDQKWNVPKGTHATKRLRSLFSKVLGYSEPSSVPIYGLKPPKMTKNPVNEPYVVLLHGTTWKTKLWPDSFWVELSHLLKNRGFKVVLPWSNPEELARAERITEKMANGILLNKMTLEELLVWLFYADAVVGVDTGLIHVAAGLDKPSIALYGATDPGLTGAVGKKVTLLKSSYVCSPCFRRECKFSDYAYPPCYDTLTPDTVDRALGELLVHPPKSNHSHNLVAQIPLTQA